MNNEINTTIPNYSSVDTMKKQPDLKKVLYVLIGVLALLVMILLLLWYQLLMEIWLMRRLL